MVVVLLLFRKLLDTGKLLVRGEALPEVLLPPAPCTTQWRHRSVPEAPSSRRHLNLRHTAQSFSWFCDFISAFELIEHVLDHLLQRTGCLQARLVCLAARKRSRHRDGPMGGAKHLPYNIGDSMASVILTVHVAKILFVLLRVQLYLCKRTGSSQSYLN